MKKIIVLAAAILSLATTTVMAQKVNTKSLLSKIEKSDDAIANEKKATKYSTWANHGKVYFNAVQEPVSDLYSPMPIALFTKSVGEPKTTGEATVSGAVFQTLEYDYFTAYVSGDQVVAWEITKDVKAGALQTAIAAYAKAYELDDRKAKTIKKALDEIVNYCSEQGEVAMKLSHNKAAADFYMNAYEAEKNPAYGEANSGVLYYAGFNYTVDGGNNVESYAKGVTALEGAIEAGYPERELADTTMLAEDKGDIYYYLFHCYYGQRESDKANLINAKDALLRGVAMFPQNEKIIEGLVQLYTSEEGVGDSSELIDIIEQRIAADPENVGMWFARGRIFSALDNVDECIKSFKEVSRLAPDMYEGYFYTGHFYTKKADIEGEAMAAKSYTKQADYDADLDAVLAIYAEAFPYLEKAHEIDPENASAIEYLKSLSFRLRDEDGMMDKYNKYNELFKQIQAQ